MTTEKQVTLKLWFNQFNKTNFVQIDDALYSATENMVKSMSERFDLQITMARDLKDIQFTDRIKK
jgi:hypothetical protein